MGSSAVLRSKTHLEKSEIDRISSKNNYINAVFTRAKNVDGFLTIKELNTITNGLVNNKILKKIIQICGSKKDILTYDDFCYFYALLNTSSFEAKLNFLLDFIFIKKEKLPKEKYIKKVKKYFSGSDLLNLIFLNENIIEKSSNLAREDIYTFVEKNYKKDLQDYSLYIDKRHSKYYLNRNEYNNINENNNTEENDRNENTVILTNNNSKENTNTSINSVNIAILKNDQFESLEEEFKNIENKNNGLFPISLLEDMLREIKVNEELITIIGDYLRKKTKKSFFNFDLFKEILSLLTSDENNQKRYYNEISKGLFTLISYPKNYIEKKNLINLFKNEKNMEKILNKLEIGKKIELNQFMEINNNNKIFAESLEHIKYLKYIFFKEKIKDRSIEKKCILILFSNNETMENYILERLQYDTNFYLIDIEFWKNWNEYIDKFEVERNYNDFRKLRINTTNFCDNNGRILEDKEFPKHYVIISETMYKLFLEWYGPPLGMNILRKKIYIDDELNNNNDETNSLIKKRKKKYGVARFSGIEKKTKRKFELELNPIFIQFHYYLGLLKNANNSKSELKYDLRKRYNREEGSYSPFSRKTKFSDIAKRINNNIDLNNIRFCIYYNDRIEKVKNSDSLEELGVTNRAIVLVEEKANNIWLSDKIQNENNKNNNRLKEENEDYFVGLFNIGNTCFMNSVLQIFLNIEEIRDIFVIEDEKEYKRFLSFILNSENKEVNSVVQKKGYLTLEFINLLREKWIGDKRTLTPRRFKEICGEYNAMFKTSDQQDAHDFYTFLVDKLHEETNIKSTDDNSYKENENSETIDTNELDLANEYWANNVRKNASYFYALFMGQLKSTLICSECNTQKIKYEPFSALEIPIPEGNNIIIDVILFRLPYTLREFDFEKYIEDDEEGNMDKKENINLKKMNKKYKKEKNEKTNFTDSNINENKNKGQNEVINNLLNLNIPLKLRIEINRKEKCSSIIDKLKCMNDINIEKNYDFTEFIMISKGKFINEDLIIDETFSNLNIVYVYELLNYKGIINIYDYEEKQKFKILSIKNQKVDYKIKTDNTFKKITTISKNQNNKSKDNYLNVNTNLNIPSFYFTINESNKKKYDKYEILTPIIHRINSEIVKGFIQFNNYQYFYNFQDFIILSSSESIRPFNLYEMMWTKYMYFLNCPSNYDNKTWWTNKKEKKYLPFIITIINKDNSSCAFCPWFRFCSGCVVDPFSFDYLNINSDCVIVIEWDKDVYTQEINKNNFSLILNHNSFNTISDKTNNNEQISIDDCLKLFTKSEEIKDIQCEKCKKKTLFKKYLQIERLPQYLVIVLKRFKYILTNSIKIHNVIKFPLEDLSLQNYVTQKNINYKYNLFGVINHQGSLEGGHYYSFFNINDSWIEFDDSHVSELNSGIETNKAYMLIYQSMRSENKDKNLNFLGLMNRAYQIYLKKSKFKHIFNYVFDNEYNITKEYLNNCEFYYGEPVTVSQKSGFIVDITKEEGKKESNNVNIRIKLKKGYFTTKIGIDKIFKETYKKKGNLDIDSLLNEGNNKIKEKENEVVCGSQVCLIY